jgi:hypothetical protein
MDLPVRSDVVLSHHTTGLAHYEAEMENGKVHPIILSQGRRPWSKGADGDRGIRGSTSPGGQLFLTARAR